MRRILVKSDAQRVMREGIFLYRKPLSFNKNITKQCISTLLAISYWLLVDQELLCAF